MSADGSSSPKAALLRPGASLASREIPPDLLADAARRLSIAALAMVFVGSVALPVMAWVEATGLRPVRPFGLLLVGFATAVSLAVHLLARRSRLSPVRLIGLGTAYEVLLCAVVSFWEQFGPFPHGEYREMSFVCLIVVLFPTLVPAPPLRTLATSLACALTGPVAYGAAVAYGYDPRPLVDVLISLTHSLVAAGLSMAPSLVITRLVTKVAAAREMGSYRLEKRIGSGGMGEVWQASHRLLAQTAAVKLIRADRLAGESTARERFRREARVTSQLRSQHTVDLYDFGLTEDGTFYYAMELLQGMDVETLVERFGPLPPARAVHLLRQACLSLEEAHRLGLVHRDIKPANLFVCHQGLEADLLKVLDFGLAGEQTPQEDTKLTAPNVIFGTPACMAPEQVKAQDVGPQADLYALGCVACFMLSGQQVFDAHNPALMMMAHMAEKPVPLRERVGDHVPQDLDDLVMRCLEKDPAARPPGALALRAMLGDLACAGQWSEEDAERWWEQHEASEEAPPPVGGIPTML